MFYEIKEKLFIINENFEEEYNNWNKIDRVGSFLLGETSSSLLKTGLLKQKIYIDKSKLIKIKNKHFEMTDELIKKIPDILNNPILILKSNSVTNRIVIFGELFAHNNPILLAMELNPFDNNNNVEKIYKVASAYGKKNIDDIQRWLNNEENILFIDNKKNRTKKWLAGLGIQLPVSTNTFSSSDKNVSKKEINNIKIKDLPEAEKPRERAIKYGMENLSNEDLLSIILKTGTKNTNVKILSTSILSLVKDINDLKNLTLNKLISINGIGKVKAIELLASLELGKRVYYINDNKKVQVNSSKKVFEYFKDFFINEKQENFYAIYLDSKSKIISYKLLFKGTINTSCVHPREVFKYAFLESAYSIIVIHNHPSGDSSPSSADIELTDVLFKIGNLMAIPVVDHIIIGFNEYYSFYENMHKK